jgi:hypothetical protein
VAACLGVTLVIGACGDGSTTPGTADPTGPRPASSAHLAIQAPRDGQTFDDPDVEVRVRLEDARLVDLTTTDIRPDEGHLHVMLDDTLVSMTGELHQTLPRLDPGQHVLTVEFVAADHLPFDPRVVAGVAFRVARS